MTEERLKISLNIWYTHLTIFELYKLIIFGLDAKENFTSKILEWNENCWPTIIFLGIESNHCGIETEKKPGRISD